jgi:hypothetical protein
MRSPTTSIDERTPDRYRTGVWGTRLRHAALAVLLRARGTPLSVADIWRQIQLNHVVQRGLRPKHLADALRHECRRGRARRHSHGHYVVGTIAPRTRRRILAHEREITHGDGVTMLAIFRQAHAERTSNASDAQLDVRRDREADGEEDRHQCAGDPHEELAVANDA